MATKYERNLLSKNKMELLQLTTHILKQLKMAKKVVIYPDLIKLKVALDDGSVLGIETTGYLNSHHTKRHSNKLNFKKEETKKVLNKQLEIQSENLAIIPTKWKTEILCWEFKGKSRR